MSPGPAGADGRSAAGSSPTIAGGNLASEAVARRSPRLPILLGTAATHDVNAALYNRINAAVKAALDTPSVRERLVQLGNTPRWESPEQFRATVKADRAKWAAVVKQIGATIDGDGRTFFDLRIANATLSQPHPINCLRASDPTVPGDVRHHPCGKRYGNVMGRLRPFRRNAQSLAPRFESRPAHRRFKHWNGVRAFCARARLQGDLRERLYYLVWGWGAAPGLSGSFLNLPYNGQHNASLWNPPRRFLRGTFFAACVGRCDGPTPRHKVRF